MSSSTRDSLSNHCVRLSVNKKPVGSGFILKADNPERCYVLTARHCIIKYSKDQPISIDFYDYDSCSFTTSLSVIERFYLEASVENKYDIAILPIELRLIPFSLTDCSLISSTPKLTRLTFRGFPNANKSFSPEEIVVESSLSSGATVSLNTIVRPEDHDTSALENVTGFSGSGLVKEENGNFDLHGIIIKYDPIFNKYTAQDLSRINYLLNQHGHRSLPILETPLKTLSSNNSIEPSFIELIKLNLTKAENFWKDLQPRQALTLVESAIESLEGSSLLTAYRNPLLARSYFIKALAVGDLDSSDECYNIFIKAYLLDKEKIKYKERAAVAYYYGKNMTKAYEIAESILNDDEENARAWLVINQLNPDLSPPDSVTSSEQYKVGKIIALSKTNPNVSANDLFNIFRDDLHNMPNVFSFNRLNIYYWTYLALTALHHSFIENSHEISSHKNTNIKFSTLFQYSISILSKIISYTSKTEFHKKESFRSARYFELIGKYYLTSDPCEEDLLINELYKIFTGEKSHIDKTQDDLLPIAEVLPDRIIEILTIFIQSKKPQLVLNTVEKVSYKDIAEVHLIIGIAHEMLNQKDEMIQSFRNYLSLISVIKQHEAKNCLHIIQCFIIKGENPKDIYSWISEGKTFEFGYIKPLIEAFCLSASTEYHIDAKRAADNVKPFWNKLENQLQKALAAIYSDLKEWSTAKELWRDLIGNGTEESDELKAYIITLFEEHKDFDELFARLAFWRQHFTPNLDLTFREIDLYRRLNYYSKQAEVAEYGMTHFPDVISFWVDRVRALYRLRDIDNLNPLLDDRILTAKLSYNVRFSIAHIYFVNNKVNIAQEACYQVLKENWSNPIVKTAYFSLTTQYKSIYEAPLPQVAQIHMVVRIVGDQQSQLIELTPEEVKHNQIAKRIIGLKVNDTFQLVKPVVNSRITYKIEQILDKYQGQSALIAEEIATKPFTGMPIQSFTTTSDAPPEALLNQLIDVFAPQEAKRKLYIEEAKRKFADYSIGFTELTQHGFGGSPVAAWEYSTSNYHDGFPIFPKSLLEKRLPDNWISKETEFVLDFSSLLTIYHISKNETNLYNSKKFIISQYTFDYIFFELEKVQNQQESKLSFNIIGEQIVPYFHPEDLHTRRIRFWIGLYEWINQFCQTDYVPDRLTWDWQRDDSNSEPIFSDKNMFTSSFTDSMLLAMRPQRVLITDDAFFYTKLQHNLLIPITTETYFYNIHNSKYNDSIWLDLVRLNMRGLTITGLQLYTAFSNNKMIVSHNSDYLKAILSYSPNYNPSSINLLSAITFLKCLYADNLLIDYKRRISRILLQTTLSGSQYINERTIKTILSKIDIEFNLLGEYGDFVKEDLLHTLETLNLSDQ
ncbi:PIN domain-containing protein [Telluribacter humicola]|uniref:PIN domain-containing protein n=1 Tax=Telluribacter humicola TaxID=1720261 RepID=UPI001A9582A1|nr:serine protease [Telluribacter humicola]